MADPGVNQDLFPDPLALISRADAVSEAIAKLRNAVQGRGVTPKGPPELAAEIGGAQEHWLEVRSKLLAGYEQADQRGGMYDAAATIEAWERRVNTLADKAIAAGLIDAGAKLEVTHTAADAGEVVAQVAERAKGLGVGLAIGLGVLGAGILIAQYWGRRGS